MPHTKLLKDLYQELTLKKLLFICNFRTPEQWPSTGISTRTVIKFWSKHGRKHGYNSSCCGHADMRHTLYGQLYYWLTLKMPVGIWWRQYPKDQTKWRGDILHDLFLKHCFLLSHHSSQKILTTSCGVMLLILTRQAEDSKERVKD